MSRQRLRTTQPEGIPVTRDSLSKLDTESNVALKPREKHDDKYYLSESCDMRTAASDFLPDQVNLVDEVILPIMLATVIAYSLIASFVTGCAWYTMILYYIAALTCFYMWHWQAHHKIPWIPFNKACYEYHTEHHWKVYPPQYYFGTPEHRRKTRADEIMSDWRNGLPGASSMQHEALIYVLGVSVLAASRVFLHVSYGTIGFAAFGFLLIGVIGNYFHMSFHVPGHWLARYNWYRQLRALHYIHHLGTAKHNYAIVNFSLDKMLHTFVLDKPEKDTPEGIDSAHIHHALRTSPLSHALIMLTPASVTRVFTAGSLQRGFSAVFVRVLWVLAGLLLWYQSQSFVASVTLATSTQSGSGGIVDRVHNILLPANEYFRQHDGAADAALSFCSLVVDLSCIIIILVSIFGVSVSGMAATALFLISRQVCELIVQLPDPDGMVWRAPNLVGSLFQSNEYHRGRHQFFVSAHLGLCVIASIELYRVVRAFYAQWRILTFTLCSVVIVAVGLLLLSLRAHWTLDVVVGVVMAIATSLLCRKYARILDSWLP